MFKIWISNMQDIYNLLFVALFQKKIIQYVWIYRWKWQAVCSVKLAWYQNTFKIEQRYNCTAYAMLIYLLLTWWARLCEHSMTPPTYISFNSEKTRAWCWSSCELGIIMVMTKRATESLWFSFQAKDNFGIARTPPITMNICAFCTWGFFSLLSPHI